MPRLASFTGQTLSGKGRGFLKYIIKNPNPYGTSSNDYFSLSAVSIDGNYAIVGAFYEDEASGSDSGKAYIFDVTTGALVHTLNNPNPYSTSTNDYFGGAVAISGNYAIVGAFGEDDTGGNSAGKAYIFNVTTGALVHTLNNPTPYSTSASDQFGGAVAISGNYAIVAARLEDDASGNDSGKAYIFNVTTGALARTLNNPTPDSTGAGDAFGTSVAISGNYAIVGAPDEDEAGGSRSGKAYIFDVTTGTLVYILNNPNAYYTSAGDAFGTSVAIDGDYIVVGAGREDYSLDFAELGLGTAHIYKTTNGTWSDATLLHSLTNPNISPINSSDIFGNTVAIDGNYVVVSAEQESTRSYDDSGVVYIFNKITGSLVYTLTNPNYAGTESSDFFGGSIAISGGNLIVGSRETGDGGYSRSGILYTYTIPV